MKLAYEGGGIRVYEPADSKHSIVVKMISRSHRVEAVRSDYERVPELYDELAAKLVRLDGYEAGDIQIDSPQVVMKAPSLGSLSGQETVDVVATAYFWPPAPEEK